LIAKIQLKQPEKIKKDSRVAKIATLESIWRPGERGRNGKGQGISKEEAQLENDVGQPRQGA
jgi:hypothetical protein